MAQLVYSNGSIQIRENEVHPSIAKALLARPDNVLITDLVRLRTRCVLPDPRKKELTISATYRLAVTGSAGCARCRKTVPLNVDQCLHALCETVSGGDTLAYDGLVCTTCVDAALKNGEITIGRAPEPGYVMCSALMVKDRSDDGSRMYALDVTSVTDILVDAHENVKFYRGFESIYDCSDVKAELRRELRARLAVRVWKLRVAQAKKARVQWTRYCAAKALGTYMDPACGDRIMTFM